MQRMAGSTASGPIFLPMLRNRP